MNRPTEIPLAIRRVTVGMAVAANPQINYVSGYKNSKDDGDNRYIMDTFGGNAEDTNPTVNAEYFYTIENSASTCHAES